MGLVSCSSLQLYIYVYTVYCISNSKYSSLLMLSEHGNTTGVWGTITGKTNQWFLAWGICRIQCWFQSLGETHLCYPFLLIKTEDQFCTSRRYQQRGNITCNVFRSHDDMGSMVSQQRSVLWTNNNSASESGSQFQMIESMILDEFWHVNHNRQ